MPSESEFVQGADSIEGLEDRAKRRLPPSVFDFMAGGAGDELTILGNQAAFRNHRLRPRVLTGSRRDHISTSTTIFGSDLAAPIYVCPMGGQAMVHPEGDLASARAARTAGIAYVASSASSVTLEDIAAEAGPRWFQLYWQPERSVTADLVQRAASAGYDAVVLTVDAPAHSERPRDYRNDFHRPSDLAFANLERYETSGAVKRISALGSAGGNLGVSWPDLEWLMSVSPIPVVLKGILTREDAALARQLPVSGIIVSNHGGRQLDRAPATIDVLPEIVEAIEGSIPVFLDSGVRRASDVVVALALGASAVGIGRPVLWALAIGGQPMAEAMLNDLNRQVAGLLLSLGTEDVSSLRRDHVMTYSGQPNWRA